MPFHPEGFAAFAGCMDEATLTGAQKAHLRGLGQTLGASLSLGREGPVPGFFAELEKLLGVHELVKLRFNGADRHERAALCEKISAETRSTCVGAVGHTALFFRRQPDPKAQRITLP
jgi:RNA-binding protein